MVHSSVEQWRNGGYEETENMFPEFWDDETIATRDQAGNLYTAFEVEPQQSRAHDETEYMFTEFWTDRECFPSPSQESEQGKNEEI